MEKYTQQCDAFRKVLEAHKLDPGELLPPPAKTRLGVSIATNGVSLTVQRLAENSRAERIGLQAGDEIRKVNGKDVGTVAELRLLIGEKEKGMTLDITRDGRDMRLEEKDEK
jgi:S1-C subfamily serine protease